MTGAGFSLLAFFVTDDDEPHVVAAAIAAYAVSDNIRVTTSLNLPPLAAVTFPTIMVIGTKLIFYKITVTADLCAAVQQGIPSITESRVFRYVPVLPRRHGLGMCPLESRVDILACSDTFKQFVGNQSRRVGSYTLF